MIEVNNIKRNKKRKHSIMDTHSGLSTEHKRQPKRFPTLKSGELQVTLG